MTRGDLRQVRLTGVGWRSAAFPDTTSYFAPVWSSMLLPNGLWRTCTSRSRIVFVLPFGPYRTRTRLVR
jgi:hypothetical protein